MSKGNSISLRRTTGPLRPQADNWDGPHFRLLYCGVDYGRQAWRPRALFMDTIEDEGTWLYVLSGNFFYKLGSRRHRVEPGHALVMRHPDPGWQIRPGGDVPLHALWLGVAGEPALKVFEYLHRRYGQIHTLPIRSDAVRLARKLISFAATQPRRPAHFWSEQTFRWLNAWWRCMEEHQTPPARIILSATTPSRLLSFGPRTFKDFAVQMGYSRSYLTRKLTDQWEESPGRVLRKARLREGARLLRVTGLSVREVAVKVGYATTAAFSRAFARQHVRTPRAYRQTHG